MRPSAITGCLQGDFRPVPPRLCGPVSSLSLPWFPPVHPLARGDSRPNAPSPHSQSPGHFSPALPDFRPSPHLAAPKTSQPHPKITRRRANFTQRRLNFMQGCTDFTQRHPNFTRRQTDFRQGRPNFTQRHANPTQRRPNLNLCRSRSLRSLSTFNFQLST